MTTSLDFHHDGAEMVCEHNRVEVGRIAYHGGAHLFEVWLAGPVKEYAKDMVTRPKFMSLHAGLVARDKFMSLHDGLEAAQYYLLSLTCGAKTRGFFQ